MNDMEFPLMYNDLCLKQLSENPTLRHILPRHADLNSAGCLSLSLTLWCGRLHHKFDRALRLAFQPSRCKLFLYLSSYTINLWAKFPGPRCTRCTQHGYVPSACRKGNVTSCSAWRTSTWTTMYHLNNDLLFIDTLINFNLNWNANAGGSVPVSRDVWWTRVNKSSGWYSTVWKTSLAFSCGINCITFTKTVHINYIRILCNWKCKWHRQ